VKNEQNSVKGNEKSLDFLKRAAVTSYKNKPYAKK
jgi:hypothetical protein